LSGNIIEIISYTYAGPQPGFINNSEFHDSYTLLAVEDGEFNFEVENQNGSATFGDLVFSPINTVFCREALGKKITFHFFRFNTHLKPHHPITEIPVGKISVSDINRLSSTFSHLRKIWREYSNASRMASFTNHLLIDLLYMCKLEDQYTLDRKKTPDPLMQQAIGYIHQHLFKEVNLQNVAKNLGITPSEFTRRFRMAYQVTPIHYVTVRRLEEVKRRLLETNDTLDAIAYHCGYDNGSYLSRVFRSKIGIAPSDFRKKHQI
jgi:AraC-like DNA-binding protein